MFKKVIFLTLFKDASEQRKKLISASQKLLAARKAGTNQKLITKLTERQKNAQEAISQILSSGLLAAIEARIEMLQDKLDIKESAKDLGRLHAHNKNDNTKKERKIKKQLEALLIKKNLIKLRSSNRPFHFIYFDKGVDSHPVLVLRKKKISNAITKKIRKKAVKKQLVKGLIRYDKEQGIFVFLLMTSPSKLQKSLKTYFGKRVKPLKKASLQIATPEDIALANAPEENNTKGNTPEAIAAQAKPPPDPPPPLNLPAVPKSKGKLVRIKPVSKVM